MIQTNNAYLCNFILYSYFLDYHPNYSPILGFESSIPFYLFTYSKNLFFQYPYIFDKASILCDSYLFFNICSDLINRISSIKNIVQNIDSINFLYLNRFNFSIYSYEHSEDNFLQVNQDFTTIEYHGLNFHIPLIENIISYEIFQYANNFNVKNMYNISILSSIYIDKIQPNTIFSNLLKLGINKKSTITKLIKNISKYNFTTPDNILSENSIKSRSIFILESCYGK
jgi:hypothetical protein